MSDKENTTLTFLLQTQQHIHENIKFADTKAAQVIGINVALIGVLYAIDEWSATRLQIVAFCVALWLSVGVLYGVSVVRPRGEQNERRGRGVVDAIRIAQFDEQAFMARSSDISTDELMTELRLFIYDRACIDRAKYEQLRMSIRISVIGWLLAFALLVLNRLIVAGA